MDDSREVPPGIPLGLPLAAVILPPREGFGHKVIKRLVALALDGSTTLDFPPEGFAWTLSVPASSTVAKIA